MTNKWQFTYQGIKCECLLEYIARADSSLWCCSYKLNGVNYEYGMFHNICNREVFKNEVIQSILRIQYPEMFPETYRTTIVQPKWYWRVWNYVRGK